MDFIALSKSLIVGKVTKDTPLVVLKELLYSIGYSFNSEKYKDSTIEIVDSNSEKIRITTGDRYLLSIINAINNSSIRLIGYPLRDQELQVACRFLRKPYPEVDKELITNELLTIKCAQEGLLYHKSILTPAIMYGITIRNTPFNAFNINSSENDIASVFLEYKKYVNTSDIYLSHGFIKFVKYIAPTTENIYEEYMKAMEKGLNYEYTKSNISIIAFALARRRIDITNASIEYVLSLENFNALESDPKNGIFRLVNRFNPMIDIRIYSMYEIDQLCTLYGVDNNLELNDIYDNLSILYVTEKTFHGPSEYYQPLGNELSLDQEPMRNTSMNEIVWFGLKTEVSMTPMNQMDLYNCFNTMKRFRNPYNNGVEFFTISAIKKLLRIATSGSLRSVIVELLRDSDTVSERVENFKNEYNSMPSEMKERVQLFFNEFLYIGFYMRGWSGKGNYPIEETTVDDQANVDINVCTQWEKMNSLFPENDPLRMRIFELPLLDWRRERGFELSSGIGRNCIGDVFRIVFSMDRDMEVNACIRLSSNYICKSSFFYITRVLEKDAPFDVSLMHDIG